MTYQGLRERIVQLECKVRDLISGAGSVVGHPPYEEHARGLEALIGADRLDYTALKNTPDISGTLHDPVTVAGGGVVLTDQQLNLVASPDAGNSVEIRANGLYAAPGTGSGVTNLTHTTSATSITIESSSGTNTEVLQVTSGRAGVMTPTMLNSLNLNTAKVSASGSINTHSDVDGTPMDGQALTWSVVNNRYQPTTITEGAGATDLTYTPAASNGTVVSSTGANATLTAVDGTNAGLMLPAQNNKLAGIEANADVTDNFNVNAAGAVMTADSATTGMQFVIDEDNMISNSNTKVPTQQSVKAYVDANAGGSPHVKQTTNKAMVHAKAASTTYSVAGGTGSLVVANFGDITHASIIVDKATDANAGSFNLDITFSDNSVNTWDVSGGANFALHDLYVPQFRFYDVGATALMVAELADKSSDQTNGIFPSAISWAAGTLTLEFPSGSSFDSISQMLIELNFPKL